MNIVKNDIVVGKSNRPFLLDAYYFGDGRKKPVLIFVHGFKGFKDWGHWYLFSKYFSREGFVFVKFNLSYNGTTIDKPYEFADLEAFGHNNYSIEIEDIGEVIDWLSSQREIPAEELDLSRIGVIGHSRGGGISMIKAAEDDRIKALATWSSVSRLDNAWKAPGALEAWREKGVFYIKNARTNEEMPLYYQLFEDFDNNKNRFDISSALDRVKIPMCIIHGTNDPAVPHMQALELKEFKPDAMLHLIEGANHVYGGRHPYTLDELPAHSLELAEISSRFFHQALDVHSI